MCGRGAIAERHDSAQGQSICLRDSWKSRSPQFTKNCFAGIMSQPNSLIGVQWPPFFRPAIRPRVIFHFAHLSWRGCRAMIELRPGETICLPVVRSTTARRLRVFVRTSFFRISASPLIFDNRKSGAPRLHFAREETFRTDRRGTFWYAIFRDRSTRTRAGRRSGIEPRNYSGDPPKEEKLQ